MNDKTPFSFCIARRWESDDPNSPLMAYAYGQQVFYGNIEYARGLLENLKSRMEDDPDEFYIYKLVKIDENESKRTN